MKMKKSVGISSFIGQKIKIYRRLGRLSQKMLADQLDVSFQQIQKYENGSNRISVDRLMQISQVLHIPYSKFFEGIDDTLGCYISEDMPNRLHEPESLEMLDLYYKLSIPARIRLQAFLKEV